MRALFSFKTYGLLTSLGLLVAVGCDDNDSIGDDGSAGHGASAGKSGEGGAAGSRAGAGSGGKSAGPGGVSGSSTAGSSGTGGADAGRGGSSNTAGVGGSGGDAGETSAGAGSGGDAPGGNGGSAGSAASGGGGTAGTGGTASGGDAGQGSGECGDPSGDGVLVFEDVHESTTWSCPVYTLTKPIFVRSTGSERTTLTITPGVVVRGVRGDLDALKFPGALVVTRSGRIDAVGTASAPIVFTSSHPVGQRGPGDWGGLALLGRAPLNTPANLADAGNVAGENYLEGLPRNELSAYGSPTPENGEGGAGNVPGAGGDAGQGGAGEEPNANLDWDCGRLEYVRIEFAGFEVAPGNELNSLTLAGCGSSTRIDRVQTHLGSDDGVEVFGGNVDLKHVVITGPKDDGLDWDQGWRGRGQFIAIQLHDDTTAPSTQKGDNGIEADGYADPIGLLGDASSPRIFNLTLIGSVTNVRDMRLREGTQLFLRDAIVVAPPGGAAQGLIDLGDVATADWVTRGLLSVQNSIFFGPWPVAGQQDGHGTLYTEADYFTTGAGSTGNDVLVSLTSLLPDATNQNAPGWVPAAGSAAAEDALDPSEAAGHTGFFDIGAVYRGAFAPGGADWTAPWAAYPVN